MLKIGWKSFGNHWPCFEVNENLSMPLVIWRSSEVVRNLWKFFKTVGNLWKPSVNLQKFPFCEDENLTHFTEKKLAGIEFSCLLLCLQEKLPFKANLAQCISKKMLL